MAKGNKKVMAINTGSGGVKELWDTQGIISGFRS